MAVLVFFVLGSLGLSGCELAPNSMKFAPLVPHMQENRHLNMKLPPQSKLFVAFESNSKLTPKEHLEYQDMLQHQFSQYFADASFDTSSQNLSGQQWLQRIGHGQVFDFLVVVRLVDASSGNLIRPYRCGEETPEFTAKAQQSLGSQPPAFGPDLSDKTQQAGVEVDEEAQDIEDLLNSMTNSTPEMTASKETQTTEIQVPAEPKPDVKPEPVKADFIKADEITLPKEARPIAYGQLPLAEKKMPEDENALTCEIHFGHGQDQVKIVTWLYNRPYGQLIDHREFDASAGLLGLQTQATPKLFEASIHRLAAQYAGKR